MPWENRTIGDSGVVLDGSLFNFAPIVGTGVTPAQAAALAQPVQDFLDLLPYTLDEHNQLAYREHTIALHHAPELVYASYHPLAGQPIVADWNGGDRAIRYQGAPMPFIDMDFIDAHSLRNMLIMLYSVRDALLNAT